MLAEIVLLLALQCAIIPDGTGNYRAEGDCTLKEIQYLARDLGAHTPLHCPKQGVGDGNCIEWCGQAPSIGAGDVCGEKPSGPKRAEVK